MKVWFVGAGPGDPELLTLKAHRLLASCRVCIYAGSLVNPRILEALPADAERHDSARLSLEDILALVERARAEGRDVIRLHTGEPAVYGAIGEQMDALDRMGVAYEIVPGVGAFQAAAAALAVELTVPETAQTVVLTRTPGRTPMPATESLDAFAATSATLCLYLSAEKLGTAAETVARLRGADTPAAVVYHASWADEKVVRGTAADIAEKAAAAGMRRTALAVFGAAVRRPYGAASKLYDKQFAHGYRGAGTAGQDQ